MQDDSGVVTQRLISLLNRRYPSLFNEPQRYLMTITILIEVCSYTLIFFNFQNITINFLFYRPL